MPFGVRSYQPADQQRARGRRADGRTPLATSPPRGRSQRLEAPGIMRLLSALWNLAALNILWIVASLPIVTLPITVYAAFGSIDRWARSGDDRVVRNFVGLIGSRPSRALVVCGAPLAVGALAVGEVVYFARRTGNLHWLCLGIGFGFLVLVLISSAYALLFGVAQPDLPPESVLQLAVRLGVRNMLFTGPLFVMEALGVTAFALVEPALVAIMLPTVFLWLVHRTALFGVRRATQGPAVSRRKPAGHGIA